MIFSHLSDLHVNPNIKKIVVHLKERYPGSIALITGDCANNARRSEFEKVEGWLEGIGKLILPGNHDYRWQGNLLYPQKKKVLKNWSETLGQYEPICEVRKGLKYEFLGEKIVFIGIDSNDSKAAFARGYVSRELCQELRGLLKKFKDYTRIVGLHHHPLKDSFLMELENGKLLMKALSGECEVLIFGHEHELYKRENKFGVGLIVSSHSTVEKFGDNLCVNMFKVESKMDVRHWMEVV